MRILSESKALGHLKALKDELRAELAHYEQRAQSCSTCDTPGACCLDEHFVNVRISRLEAAAIINVIDKLPPIRRSAVDERIANSASVLTNQNEHTPTFACPLYEKGTGCLVHHEAKPVPCIIHACYEQEDDLPPDALQDSAELPIDKFNARVYAAAAPLTPLPIALAKLRLIANG
jgi:hypothetical protein